MRRAKLLNILIFIALCLTLLVAAYLFASNTPAAAEQTFDGKPFFRQDFEFKDNKGISHHLYDFKQKKLIVHLWATWCPPCVEELPSLLKYIARNPDVTVLALSSDEDEKTMNNFLKGLNVKSDLPNVIMVWDRDRAYTQQVFSVTQYPETFIFDPGLLYNAHIEGPMDWNTVTTK